MRLSMHVAADEDLAGPGLERVEVDVPAAQAGTVAVEAADAGGVDEDAPALAGGDEAEDAGRAAVRAGDDDDVVEPADGVAAGVEQGQAHHPERVDEVACHVARLPLPFRGGACAIGGCPGLWEVVG